MVGNWIMFLVNSLCYSFSIKWKTLLGTPSLILLIIMAFDLETYWNYQNRRIELPESPENLEALASACDIASFGLGQEDVFDPSYRQALKLDTGDFAINFNPESLGLLKTVRHSLLDGSDNRLLRTELYKLNIYRQGGFFKAHVDTPRVRIWLGRWSSRYRLFTKEVHWVGRASLLSSVKHCEWF
jgi:hypothetical protein